MLGPIQMDISNYCCFLLSTFVVSILLQKWFLLSIFSWNSICSVMKNFPTFQKKVLSSPKIKINFVHVFTYMGLGRIMRCMLKIKIKIYSFYKAVQHIKEIKSKRKKWNSYFYLPAIRAKIAIKVIIFQASFFVFLITLKVWSDLFHENSSYLYFLKLIHFKI